MAEPTYGTPADRPVANRSNGAAIVAVVTGVLALLLSWIPLINLVAVLLGLVAVIAGVIGLRNASSPGVSGRGKAVTGIVTGVLALVLGILVYVGIASFITDNPEIQQELEQMEDQLQQQS